MVGQGKGKGKGKIEMARIVEKPKRWVTFSKRRKGLFKKSAELDVLCGSDTAIISVSEAGTIFAAGRPSFVHGLLLGSARGGGRGGVEFDDERLKRMGWDELAAELAALNEAELKMELLMMERLRNNNGNANAVLSDSVMSEKAHVAFSSASVMMSEKAHAFVHAAPLNVLPAFTTPSLPAFSSDSVMMSEKAHAFVDAAAAAPPLDVLPASTTPSLPAFSSASAMSEKAHAFVDAAAALPDIPASTTPSSSELEWSELSEVDWSELELPELCELEWSSVAVGVDD